MAGCRPLFVDCDDRFNMDLRLLGFDAVPWRQQERRREPAAVVFVHTYGRRLDLAPVEEARSDDGVCVIEDLAEAHGLRPSESTDAACWSFYSNKVVRGEEGGAVWFADAGLAALARSLRSLGASPLNDHDCVPRGLSARLSNANASLVLDSLIAYDDELRARRWRESQYALRTPRDWLTPYRDVPWFYDVRVPGLTSDQQRRLIAKLQGAGVAARFPFKPCSSQPEFGGCELAGGAASRLACRELILLPLDPRTVDEASIERAMNLLEGVDPG